MNQGRIWCVVNPSVGLPLFLTGVALTSLAVHTAVMTHTTWMGNYWMGSARVRVSDNPVPASTATASAFAVTVTPVASTDAKTPASFVITFSPNAAATASASSPTDEANRPTPNTGPIQAASAN